MFDPEPSYNHSQTPKKPTHRGPPRSAKKMPKASWRKSLIGRGGENLASPRGVFWPEISLKKKHMFLCHIPWRIHGAGIYTNIYGEDYPIYYGK